MFYLPTSNLSLLMSTPMIRVAPAALHPITAANPTAPKPHTAHVEPGSTWINNLIKIKDLVGIF